MQDTLDIIGLFWSIVHRLFFTYFMFQTWFASNRFDFFGMYHWKDIFFIIVILLLHFFFFFVFFFFLLLLLLLLCYPNFIIIIIIIIIIAVVVGGGVIAVVVVLTFDTLKPHLYIPVVKLGFTVVYIIFHILLKHIDDGYSLEPPRRDGSNEYPQSMF